MTERILARNEKEYKKLEFVAKALELESPNNKKYSIKDTYLDFGLDWMWTTIISEDCQVLSSREWKDIMVSETIDDLLKVVKDIRNGKWFGDK